MGEQSDKQDINIKKSDLLRHTAGKKTDTLFKSQVEELPPPSPSSRNADSMESHDFISPSIPIGDQSFIAGRPTLVCLCVVVHRRTSIICSSLLLQQFPVCITHLTWIVCSMGGKWPCSCCFEGCCY